MRRKNAVIRIKTVVIRIKTAVKRTKNAVRKTSIGVTRTSIEIVTREKKIKREVIVTKINIKAAVMNVNHHHQRIKTGSTRVHHHLKTRNTSQRTEIAIVTKIATGVTRTSIAARKINTPALRTSTGLFILLF